MNRLTKKIGVNNDALLLDYTDFEKSQMIHKLGRIEDIEQELGIDLITLFEALKNGITEQNRNTIIYYTPDRLSIEYKYRCLRKGTTKFYFADYGKTWFVGDQLMKEELE